MVALRVIALCSGILDMARRLWLLEGHMLVLDQVLGMTVRLGLEHPLQRCCRVYETMTGCKLLP